MSEISAVGRSHQHFKSGDHSGLYVSKAIRHFRDKGDINISYHFMPDSSVQEIRDQERALIDKHDSQYPNGYNRDGEKSKSTEIASDAVVSRVITKLKVPGSFGDYYHIKEVYIRNLYASGMSADKIAQTLGINSGMIKRRLESIYSKRFV